MTLIPAPRMQGMTAYKVPRHPAPIALRLDGNEGAVPPADLLEGAVGDPELLRRYPDRTDLRAAIAVRVGAEPEQVIVTCGGDDALDRAIRAMLCPGRNLILPVPSFEMIRRYATWADGEVREVDWQDGPWPLDAVLDIADEHTAVVAVVSPNNPTGCVATEDQLRTLSAKLPGALVLLDHAYVEFADHDLTRLALELPNVVAFRTLSKAWGLAGLRVGYAVGPTEVIDWMRAAGNPYTVSGPSVRAALASLDRTDIDAFVTQVKTDRARLSDLLNRHDIATTASEANFVYARTPKAPWLREALAGLGIGVRGWPGHPTLGDAIRITCPGNVSETDTVVHALETALAPEALLLDMDGVIADVGSSYRTAIVQTAAELGVSITLDDVRAAKAAGNANDDWVLTHRLVTERGVDISLAEVTSRFERLYQGAGDLPGLKRTESLAVDPDVLRAWAERYPLAIVTGRPRRDALEFLDRFGLADLTDVISCMEDGPSKPDPFVVRLAMRKLGITRAWMLGDTPDDQRAARAAGVVPIGVVAPGEDPERATDVLLRAGASCVVPHTAALSELLP